MRASVWLGLCLERRGHDPLWKKGMNGLFDGEEEIGVDACAEQNLVFAERFQVLLEFLSHPIRKKKKKKGFNNTLFEHSFLFITSLCIS
jgi:hypothetical protein